MMIFSRANQPLNFILSFILRYSENVLSVMCIHACMYTYIYKYKANTQQKSRSFFHTTQYNHDRSKMSTQLALALFSRGSDKSFKDASLVEASRILRLISPRALGDM